VAVFFIFLVGVLNLGLGFGVAVVIKRRYEARIATEPTEQAATEPDAEEQSAFEIKDTAEEAIEAVEELLSQVGLQPTGDSEADATDEGDSDDDDETDSEDTVEAAD
jgi:hypothetical protein